MTWTLHRWTWVLEGPLFVGHVPAGSLNRCRLFIPARAVWGAVTAEAARIAAKTSPPYKGVGDVLREDARFSYLYPAEHVNGRWVAWLPRFDEDGLCWEREDGNGGPVADRAFRRRLLSARPGTAIDPTSDSAAEGSLRETECVCDRWRGESALTDRVAYVGYVFTRSDEACRHVERPRRIFVGGDTRYGLGSLSLDSLEHASTLFGSSVDLTGASPSVSADRVLAHATTKAQDGIVTGSRERLTGREHSSIKSLGDDLTWVPGSTSDKLASWAVNADGAWMQGGR